MSAPSTEIDVPTVRDVIAAHFVMWRDLPQPLSTTIPCPPGEWRCSCGLKFGFSDMAIDHVAAEVTRVIPPEGGAA